MFLMHCWRIPPTAVLEASTVIDVSAPSHGCDSMVAFVRAVLVWSKAPTMASDHRMASLGLPTMAVNIGCMMLEAAGMKQW